MAELRNLTDVHVQLVLFHKTSNYMFEIKQRFSNRVNVCMRKVAGITAVSATQASSVTL